MVHAVCKGLKSPIMYAVAIDPVNPNVWLALAGNAGSYTWWDTNYTGIYRSTDAGLNWTFVQGISVPHNRITQRPSP